MSDLVKHDQEVIDDITIMANDWKAGFWPRALARATLRILSDRAKALEAQSAELERLRSQVETQRQLLEWLASALEWGEDSSVMLNKILAGMDAAKAGT